MHYVSTVNQIFGSFGTRLDGAFEWEYMTARRHSLVPQRRTMPVHEPVKIGGIFKVDFDLLAVFVDRLAHGVYRKNGGQV